jgi:hypothetical protein
MPSLHLSQMKFIYQMRCFDRYEFIIVFVLQKKKKTKGFMNIYITQKRD